MNKELTFTELAAAIDEATKQVDIATREVEQVDAQITALLAKQEAELDQLTKLRFEHNNLLGRTVAVVNNLHKEMHNKLTGARPTDTPKPDPTAKELKDLYLSVQKNRR